MQNRFLLIGDSMQFPNLHSTYSVETKDTKIMKDNLNDALNLATDMQQNGKDVEVYKLSLIHI